MHNSHSGLSIPKHNASDVRNLFSSSICSMEYELGTNKAPWGVAYFGGVHLNTIDVFRDEGLGLRRVLRTRRHIMEGATGDFIVSIPLRTQISIAQDGSMTHCGPGGFMILPTSKPFSASVISMYPQGRFTQLLGKVSGATLRQLVPQIDAFPSLPVKLQAGAGNLMKSLFELALVEGNLLSSTQAADFGDTLVRTIANVVCEAPEYAALQTQPYQSSLARIRESAKDYILRSLSNPQLDSRLVASHCQVSERYLHAAFASSATKVGAYIREARLQKCRATLQNPALWHRSIVDIAMSWGFVDPTSFNRTYKARFGKTPGQERTSSAIFIKTTLKTKY